MRFENDIIKLCKRGSSCGCPSIESNDNGYTITDDYHGKINLTKDEFFDIANAIRREKKRLKNSNN